MSINKNFSNKFKYIYVEYLDAIGDRMYCYTSTEDFEPGDIVIVPRGYNDNEAYAKVITTKYYKPGEEPYPVIRLKKIYGKIDKKDFDINTYKNDATIDYDEGYIPYYDDKTDEIYDIPMDEYNQIQETIEEPKNEQLDWRWCLVGNIVDYRIYGQKHEIKHGTKNFSPGTKVYVAPNQWGDGGEQLVVLGNPRNKKGFIECVIRSEFIHNFRLKKVYSPLLIKRMNNSKYTWWGNDDEWKKCIEEIAIDRNKNIENKIIESELIDCLNTPFGDFIVKANGKRIKFKLINKQLKRNNKIYKVKHIEIDVRNMNIGDKIICEIEGCKLEYNDSDEKVVLLTAENKSLIIGVAGFDSAYHGEEENTHSFELDNYGKNYEYSIHKDPKKFKNNYITLDIKWLTKNKYVNYDDEIFGILC